MRRGGATPADRYQFAYTLALGELFCVAFLGVGSVGGTYFLSTNQISWPALTTGLAVGSLTAAVLLVNNYRDVVSDARVGRKTLPITVGPQWTIAIFGGLMLMPFPTASGHQSRSTVWSSVARACRPATRAFRDLSITPASRAARYLIEFSFRLFKCNLRSAYCWLSAWYCDEQKIFQIRCVTKRNAC